MTATQQLKAQGKIAEKLVKAAQKAANTEYRP
jgi:uncharacterized protein YfeS